jgi:dephospho-CoA kinase
MKLYSFAFSGSIASGKSSLSLLVAKELNWPYVSFGDYIRSVARFRGLPESRQVLQALGQSLIEEGWEQFCRLVLNQVPWKPGQALVIDGVRHTEAIITLRRLISPAELLVIYISTSEAVRKIRAFERGETLVQDVQDHPTEIQVKNQLPQMADLIVDGDKPITEINQEIAKWFRQLRSIGSNHPSKR